MFSIQLCFCTDGFPEGSPSCLTPVLGNPADGGALLKTTLKDATTGITKRVAKMTWNLDGGTGGKGTLGHWLTYKDGTTQSLASPNTGITTPPVYTQTFCGNMIGVGTNYKTNGGGTINFESAGDSYDDVPVNYYTLTKYFTDFTYILAAAMVTK